jgi:hypothetical protein
LTGEIKKLIWEKLHFVFLLQSFCNFDKFHFTNSVVGKNEFDFFVNTCSRMISFVFNHVPDTAATVMMLTTEPAMAMMDTVTPMQMTTNTASSSSAVHATLEPVLLETLEPVLETLEPVLEPRPVRQGNLVIGLRTFFIHFCQLPLITSFFIFLFCLTVFCLAVSFLLWSLLYVECNSRNAKFSVVFVYFMLPHTHRLRKGE